MITQKGCWKKRAKVRSQNLRSTKAGKKKLRHKKEARKKVEKRTDQKAFVYRCWHTRTKELMEFLPEDRSEAAVTGCIQQSFNELKKKHGDDDAWTPYLEEIEKDISNYLFEPNTPRHGSAIETKPVRIIRTDFDKGA